MVDSILNDKGATLFNESILSLNILSALKKLAWSQSVKENPYIESFSIFDYMPAKGNVFTPAKIIKAKPPENVFFVHLNVSSISTKFVSIRNS